MWGVPGEALRQRTQGTDITVISDTLCGGSLVRQYVREHKAHIYLLYLLSIISDTLCGGSLGRQYVREHKAQIYLLYLLSVISETLCGGSLWRQ